MGLIAGGSDRAFASDHISVEANYFSDPDGCDLVFLVNAVVTLGLRGDYFYQWLGSFLIAWPIAAGVAFIAIPLARQAAQKIVLN
jgi:hypothetical protein